MKIVFCVLICHIWQSSAVRTIHSLTTSDDESDDDNLMFAAIDQDNSNSSDSNLTTGIKQHSEYSQIISKRIREKVIHIPKNEILQILSLMGSLKELDRKTENSTTNIKNSDLIPLNNLTPPHFENNTKNFHGKNEIPTRYLNKLSFLRKTFIEELERRQNDNSSSTNTLYKSNHGLGNELNFQDTNSWESNNITTTRRGEFLIPDILLNAISRRKENTEFRLYR